MRVFTKSIVRPLKTKKKRSKSDEKLNNSMKDMNLKGGSAPILLGSENNYLINKSGGSILQRKATKKNPIKLLL